MFTNQLYLGKVHWVYPTLLGMTLMAALFILIGCNSSQHIQYVPVTGGNVSSGDSRLQEINDSNSIVSKQSKVETSPVGLPTYNGKVLGYALKDIPNDSLLWIGEKNGKTISVDIKGNVNEVQKLIEEIQFLPERELRITITKQEFPFLSQDYGRAKSSPHVSPFDGTIAIGGHTSGRYYLLNLETNEYEYIIDTKTFSKSVSGFDHLIPKGWVSPNEFLFHHAINGTTLESPRFGGLLLFNVSTRSFSDYLDPVDARLGYEAIPFVLPNGNAVAYPTVWYDMSPTDYMIYDFETGQNRDFFRLEDFFDSGPIGVTTTELISQNESAKADFFVAGSSLMAMGDCVAEIDGETINLCSPLNEELYLPWPCGISQYVTRHTETSCTYDDCGFNIGPVESQRPLATGWRMFSGSHGYQAIDFADTKLANLDGDDLPVLATYFGVVQQKGIGTGTAGERIWLRHELDTDGDEEPDFFWHSGYFHFSKPGEFSLETPVSIGDTIGFEGMSGGVDGNHIHMETWVANSDNVRLHRFWPQFHELDDLSLEMPDVGRIYVSQNNKDNPGNDCNRFETLSFIMNLDCGVVTSGSTTDGTSNIATYYSLPTDFNGGVPDVPYGYAGPQRDCSGPEVVYRLSNTAPAGEYRVRISGFTAASELQVYALKGNDLIELDPMQDCIGVSCHSDVVHNSCFPDIPSGEAVVWIRPEDNPDGGDIYIVVDGKEATSFTITAECLCEEAFEPNNTLAEAGLVGAFAADVQTLVVNACLPFADQDEDWYVVALDEAGQLTVDLDDNNNQLHMRMYDAAGNQIGQYSNGLRTVRWCAAGQSCEAVYVRVYRTSTVDYGPQYNLEFDWSPSNGCVPSGTLPGSPLCEDCSDDHEPDNVLADDSFPWGMDPLAGTAVSADFTQHEKGDVSFSWANLPVEAGTVTLSVSNSEIPIEGTVYDLVTQTDIATIPVGQVQRTIEILKPEGMTQFVVNHYNPTGESSCDLYSIALRWNPIIVPACDTEEGNDQENPIVLDSYFAGTYKKVKWSRISFLWDQDAWLIPVQGGTPTDQFIAKLRRLELDLNMKLYALPSMELLGESNKPGVLNETIKVPFPQGVTGFLAVVEGATAETYGCDRYKFVAQVKPKFYNSRTAVDPSSVVVYPNPTTGTITLKTGEVIEQIDLLNHMGVLVQTWTGILQGIDQGDLILSLDKKLPEGVYFLRIAQNNDVLTKKISLLR